MNKPQSATTDLKQLVDIDNIPEDIPTNAKIQIIASAVGKTKQDISQINTNLDEIKLALNSALNTAKVLIIAVPIIAVIFSGAAWLVLHVTIK